MPAEPLIAWVDALGAVLLRPGERLTLGGPPGGKEQADLPLVAPLRPVCAALVRAGEGWAVQTLGGDRDGELTALGPGGAFALGEDGTVRGSVTVPNALSAAAVVRIASVHRPAPGWGPVRLEHAVIAAGPVVFGAGTDCHVRVRGAGGTLLFRAGPNGWTVRGAEAPGEATPAGGAAALEWRPVAAGDSLAGGGVSLRLEALPAP